MKLCSPPLLSGLAGVAAALTILCPARARAVVIASDSFSYPTGSCVGQSGGVGWSGAWTGTQTNGRTYNVNAGTFTVPGGYTADTSGGTYLAVTGGDHSRPGAAPARHPHPAQSAVHHDLLLQRPDIASVERLHAGGCRFPRFLDENSATLFAFGVGLQNQIRITTSNYTDGGTINVDNFCLSSDYASAVRAPLAINQTTLDNFRGVHPRLYLNAQKISDMKAKYNNPPAGTR